MTARKEAIGKTIRTARERLNLTREDLAARVGLDIDSIKKIELGLRVNQWLRVADFAEALQISPNELFGYPNAFLDNISTALQPILIAYGASSKEAEKIGRELVNSVIVASSVGGDASNATKFRIAGEVVASQVRSTANKKNLP